jgi:protein tyrosine/serine phosphatase
MRALTVIAALLGLAAPARSADQTEDLPRFQEVSPGITRSGQPTADGMNALKALGVRTLLDLTSKVDPEEEREAQWLGIQIVHVPMGGVFSPTYTQVDRALSALADPALRPIHVHCRQGKDRTGVVVAAWRAAAEGRATEQAAKEAKSLGCCTLFFSDLDRYLRRYLKHRRALKAAVKS